MLINDSFCGRNLFIEINYETIFLSHAYIVGRFVFLLLISTDT